MKEIPTKPYLLRALFEWCVDNGYRPYLYVNVDAHTQVPPEYVKDGQIILDISPNAVHKLQMGNELIEFSARFGGVARQISVPVANVQALKAKETKSGGIFDAEGFKLVIAPQSSTDTASNTRAPSLPAPVSEPPKKPSGGGKPTLRRIK